MTRRTAFAALAALTTLSGCAAGPAALPVTESRHLAEIARAPTLFEKDRRAILAMLGEYEVDFGFQETVVLKAGYGRHEPKHTGAHEAVVLVEDSGRRIVLQHLLIAGGHVVKHWRQDWLYEAPTRFEFTQDQVWRVKPVARELTTEAWTQCVYEVSDAPRYCGTGKWNHRYGVATWTSDRSWRPLPRREYTVRADYNAINAENRHTIVPGGWTHEQDNTKVVRDGERTAETLAREFGLNDYRRIEGFDFAPAYRYWDATRDYWSRVRNEWASRLAAADGLHLKTKVDGTPVIEAFFAQAGRIQGGGTVSDDDIRAVFAQWVESPGAARVSAAAPPDRATTFPTSSRSGRPRGYR
jgi:hypothetical protein